MQLQGRDLQQGLTGNDVKLLHSELAMLGLPVAQNELDPMLFGPTTLAVVKAFQAQHGLEATGVVDAVTAMHINRAVDASTYVVSGTVTSPDRAGLGGLRVQIVDKNVGRSIPLAE